MLGAHYRDHAPSFVKEVPAQIHQECQRWGYGPLELRPCESRDPVQVLVWKIVEGKMGHRGAPKDRKKASQQSKPTLLQGQVHSPGWVHEIGASL
jgi:hypothetical protein